MKDYSDKEENEQDDFWTLKESLWVAGWIAATAFVFLFLPWMIKL